MNAITLTLEEVQGIITFLDQAPTRWGRPVLNLLEQKVLALKEAQEKDQLKPTTEPVAKA